MSRRPKLPLQGVRVADFSWYGAGPIGTLPLAWYGAEVIRIESERHPDGLRRTTPVRPGQTGLNVSGYYNNFNSNKLSLSLNMDRPEARQIALQLIAICDVVVENYQPSVFEKWGLTYEALKDVRPDIIFVRMPMAGTTGPQREFGGFGAVMTAVTGINYLAGHPDMPPAGLGTSYPDFVVNAGHQAIAVLSALRHRRRTGEGQYVELAQLESTTCVIGPAVLEYAVNRHVVERNGNRDERAAPHGIFPCLSRPYPPRYEGIANPGMAGPFVEVEDRWCAITVFSDKQWAALRRVMGEPGWAAEERFATFAGRKANEAELERLIGEWTCVRTAEAVAEALQAAGVPAGVVQTAEDVVEHDVHLRQRGYYVRLDHPEVGPSLYDGSSYRLSRTPGGPDRPAPLLGEHTFHLAKEVMGLSEEQIGELVLGQILY